MVNVAILGGRIVKDAAAMETKTNQTIVSFSMANNQKYKDKENTTFIDVTVFGNYAKAMQPHLIKGVAINVIGSIIQESWEKDGKKYSKHKIIAKEIDFRNTKDKGDDE